MLCWGWCYLLAWLVCVALQAERLTRHAIHTHRYSIKAWRKVAFEEEDSDEDAILAEEAAKETPMLTGRVAQYPLMTVDRLPTLMSEMTREGVVFAVGNSAQYGLQIRPDPPLPKRGKADHTAGNKGRAFLYLSTPHSLTHCASTQLHWRLTMARRS